MDDTLFARVKAAAAAKARALRLAAFAEYAGGPTRVFEQIGPEGTNVLFPCLLLTSEGEAEELLPGSADGDEVAWKIRVYFADRFTVRQHDKEAAFTRDRRRLIRAFHGHQTLPGVPEVCDCTVQPLAVVDAEMLKGFALVAGSLVLRFVTFEEIRKWPSDLGSP